MTNAADLSSPIDGEDADDAADILGRTTMGINVVNLMMMKEFDTDSLKAGSVQVEHYCRIELDTRLTLGEYEALQRAIERKDRMSAIAILINARHQAKKPLYEFLVSAALLSSQPHESDDPRPKAVHQMIRDYGLNNPVEFVRLQRDHKIRFIDARAGSEELREWLLDLDPCNSEDESPA